MERPELRVYRREGRRLPLNLYRAGPRLVLLSPGFGGACSDYGGLARAWQEEGYTVAVLEHPGSARLQALRLAPYRLFRTPQQLRPRAHRPAEVAAREADARFLLGRLRAELRPPRVVMAGHSFGSHTALSLASEVDAVLAFSPHPPGWLRPPEQYCFACPCLMIVGDRDAPFEARLEAARLSGAELAVVPGAGHMLWAAWRETPTMRQGVSRSLEFMARSAAP